MRKPDHAKIAREYLQSIAELQTQLGYESNISPAVYGDALTEITRVFERFASLSERRAGRVSI